METTELGRAIDHMRNHMREQGLTPYITVVIAGPESGGINIYPHDIIGERKQFIDVRNGNWNAAIAEAWEYIFALGTPEQRRMNEILELLAKAESIAADGDGRGDHAVKGMWTELAGLIQKTAAEISKNAITGK